MQVFVLAVEYPGYSLYKSQTEISESQLIQDGETVVNCMIEKYRINPSRIIIVGRSLGSGIACALASRFRPAGLILISPLKSIQEVAKEHYGTLTAMFVKDRFNNAKYISQAQCPVLIVHGPQDKLVPLAHAQELQGRIMFTKRIVPFVMLHGHSGRDDSWDRQHPSRNHQTSIRLSTTDWVQDKRGSSADLLLS